MSCIQFSKFVDQVFKVFDMPTLVRADCDGVCIFLDSSIHDFLHRSIVSQVDYFGTAGLQDTAHDIDSRIMAIEQARRGHEPQPALLGCRR
jgi:hypothetical protein